MIKSTILKDKPWNNKDVIKIEDIKVLLMKEGSFMWAVEQMKQGKKVRRFIASKEEVYGLDSTRNFVIQSVLNKNKFNRVGISMVEYEATDWEVVEEPKKTLNDKRGGFQGDTLRTVDVKESLKEFIDSLKQLKGSYVHRKAQEIFGEELIGDKND